MYRVLIIIQIASIFALLIESAYVFNKMRTEVHRFLFLNCAASVVNSTGYLIEMMAKSEEAYLRGLQMSYVGKIWIVYSLFMFLMLVCHKKVNKIVRASLALAHVFIGVLVFASEWTPLYYESREYVTAGVLFPIVKTQGGIAHVLYDIMIICYIIVGVCNLIWYICHTKSKTNKKRLFFVLAAVLADAAGYIVHLFVNIGGYDCTNLGFAFGTLFMGVAIFRYRLMDTLQLIRDYVVDELPEAIIAVNDAGGIDFTNRSADEIIKKLENNKCEVIECLRKNANDRTPIEIDGKTYSVEENTVEDDSEKQSSVFVLVDETDHYKYLREVSEQKEIAEKANASKSRFLSVVTHEIRTPMNAILGMADLLLKEPEKLDETQMKYISSIKSSSDALVMIVNDILDQSKIEAGKMELVEEAYEIRTIADDVKLIIENRIGTKEIELIIEISDDVPTIMIGDGLRIRQILINLLNNAVKFTEKGFVKLRVSVLKDGADSKLLRFSISDSGQGIKPEDLSKLGEAFAQVDIVANHQKEGTGLGLSISRDFIALMKGKLEIKSEYGKGSEFYFDIYQKLKKTETETEENAADKVLKQKKTIKDLAGKRILVVDDSEINLMIAEAMLSRMNMEVDTATLGTKAIEKLRENGIERKYDVIFMDYMMPHMDGIETTAKIRKLAEEYANEPEKAEYFSKVCIIALTADDSEDTKAQFISAGVNGFSDKPIDIRKIIKFF